MARYYVSAAIIRKGGSAAGYAKYIMRAEGEQKYRYGPGQGREDLVARGSGALPGWAGGKGEYFFQMADRYERANGRVARSYTIMLPRELSAEGRLELAEDIRETFFAMYPHVWGLHNCRASDGGEQPHLHVLLSERRPVEEVERGPKQYFARPAVGTQDRARHGTPKDQSWEGPARLLELRSGVATLVNAALEREGIEAAVSHERLAERGHERAPEQQYPRQAGIQVRRGEPVREGSTLAHVLEERVALTRDHHPWENAWNRVAWEEQKQREGLDVSREVVRDQVRDHFWRDDHSRERQVEREASQWRALERAWSRAPEDALWQGVELRLTREYGRGL